MRAVDDHVLMISTTGGQRVRAMNRSGVDVTADASQSEGTRAAVAISSSDVVTRAFLAGQLALHADDVLVEADNRSVSTRSAAVSGDRRTDGLGALAVDVARVSTSSGLEPGAVLVARPEGATGISFVSRSGADTTAMAGGASESLAVLAVDHTTSSQLADGSSLSGFRNLTGSAVTEDDAQATVALDGGPGYAVALTRVTTTARLGTGPHLTLLGDLAVTATQRAAVSATAPTAALVIAEHSVDARSLRSVTAAGEITVAAAGDSSARSLTAPAAWHPDVVRSTRWWRTESACLPRCSPPRVTATLCTRRSPGRPSPTRLR